MRTLRILIGIVPVLLVGCDWMFMGEPPNAFGLLTGTVVAVDGTPVPNSGMFYSCGITGPGGSLVSTAPTDRDGRFRIRIDGVVYPEQGQDVSGSRFDLRCRIVAPSGSPPQTLRYVLVPFRRKKADRVSTVIHLQYGVKDTLPSGWTIVTRFASTQGSRP